MSWSKIISTFVAMTGQAYPYLKPLLLWLLEKIRAELDGLGTFAGDGVGAAPDEFKAKVQEIINTLITKYVNRPLVRMALLTLSKRLTGDLLDQAWDALFGGSTPPVMFACGPEDTAVFDEIDAACKA